MKHVFPLNKRFRQIIKLSRLCDKHNIPYDMKRFMDGWALSIPNNESELCCVTQHSFSEGGKKNLLEIEFYIGGYESKGMKILKKGECIEYRNILHRMMKQW